MKNLTQLLAGVVLAFLGVVTVVTGRIRSPTIREMSANGSVARFIGVLILIMAAMTLVDWGRKQRSQNKLK
jgi:hypothetical protein